MERAIELVPVPTLVRTMVMGFDVIPTAVGAKLKFGGEICRTLPVMVPSWELLCFHTSTLTWNGGGGAMSTPPPAHPRTVTLPGAPTNPVTGKLGRLAIAAGTPTETVSPSLAPGTLIGKSTQRPRFP